jgi:hypothetical protein
MFFTARAEDSNGLSLVGFGNVLAEHFRVPSHDPAARSVSAPPRWTHVEILNGEHPRLRRLAAEIVLRASGAPPRMPRLVVKCNRSKPEPFFVPVDPKVGHAD